MATAKKILHTQYFTLENEKEIKFSIIYVKGVGYRVSSHPVKRSKSGGCSMEEFEAYSGFNDTLLVCNRAGAARLREAIEILKSRMQKYYEWYKSKYDWSIENIKETT